jgi:hypothetical protein
MISQPISLQSSQNLYLYEEKAFFESTTYLFYKFFNSIVKRILVIFTQHSTIANLCCRYHHNILSQFKLLTVSLLAKPADININTRWRWLVSFTLSADLCPGMLSPQYPLCRRLQRPESWLECAGKQKISCVIRGFTVLLIKTEVLRDTGYVDW